MSEARAPAASSGAPELDSETPSANTAETQLTVNERPTIKCLVWDLDNTVWAGVLLEGDEVQLRPKVVEIIKTLDSRGVLQSIASKNDFDLAMEKLRSLGLREYFLYPQINWNSKVSSIIKIAESINVGLDAVAFIDDQSFERQEVAFSLPQVLCLDSAQLDHLLEMPRMNPRLITADSKLRRLMYLNDIERKRIEEEFVGSKVEFLASLGMVLTVAVAQEEDLQRAEELTVRTNQLNTTGYTYSYDELNYFRCSPQHKLLISNLEDRFGSYGKIGLVLIESSMEVWTIKLLLMSCRVMARGVGAVMLSYIVKEAKKAGVILRADFVSNDRNRMMYLTYKFAGFREISRQGESRLLENDLALMEPFPAYPQITQIPQMLVESRLS